MTSPQHSGPALHCSKTGQQKLEGEFFLTPTLFLHPSSTCLPRMRRNPEPKIVNMLVRALGFHALLNTTDRLGSPSDSSKLTRGVSGPGFPGLIALAVLTAHLSGRQQLFRLFFPFYSQGRSAIFPLTVQLDAEDGVVARFKADIHASHSRGRSLFV